MSEVVPHERIEKRIHELRGKKVMLDADLAELYGVETRALNQAVTRNVERFPEDFMFTLTLEEAIDSRSQNVIMKRGENIKYPPRAFTEHGILMLSSVLRSATAIQVNIQIMRTFSKMREMMQGYRDLIERIQKIERRQDVESREIWKAIRLLQSTVMK
ncbi:MAG: ORF6N domain-containing protein [Spirochaetia bacterium]|jgi:hypothetical protein